MVKIDDQKSKTVVEVNMPATVQIELVQGNELTQYEIFSWATSILISIASGFWTGYFTLEIKSSPLLASAVVFSLLGIGSFCMSLYYRSKIHGRKVKITKCAVLDDFNIKF